MSEAKAPKEEAKEGKAAEGGEAAAPKKSKKKLMIIIIAAVVLLLAGGGAAAFMLMGKSKEAVAEQEDKESKDGKEVKEGKETKKEAKKDAKKGEEKKGEHKPPVFVDTDAFVVNLRDTEADRLMQVKLVFEVKDEHAAEEVKNMMPAVRNEILLVLSGKESAQVVTRDGKEQLAKELVEAASKTLEHTPAEKAIQKVNFSQLIVQ